MSDYRIGGQGHRRKRLIVSVFLCLGLVSLITLAVFLSPQLNKSPAKAERSITVSADAPKQKEVISSHMMFVGDVFWGRAIQTAAERTGKDIFSRLTPGDKKDYDAWIGDLECPVTSHDISYRTQVDSLVFNCQPKYTAAAAKWFDIFTLANNHTANNDGSWGLNETRKNLEIAGIQYFGNYDMGQLDDICEIVAMPATSSLDAEKVSIPVAMCGYDYVGNVAATDQQMEIMQKYAKVVPVIVMAHMGVEYRATAEPAKEEVFRRLIDNGADVVIGDHPHVVQNSEVYKGRLIVYSTGNFLFDQQILGQDTILSLGVGLNLTIDDQKANEIYKRIGSTCKTFRDNCLAQLQKDLPSRPLIQVKYDFQYFEESSGTSVRANETIAGIIKKRANVDQLTNLATSW